MAVTLQADHRSLLEAVAFAARAHDGQLRKDGETPYVSHPFRVCLVVRDIFGFGDPRMLLTAILHDTIEDTTTDFDELEQRFGAEVARWVACLTKDKRLAEQERERSYLDGLLAAPWQVQACKLGDIFDNLMDAGQLPSELRERTLKRSTYYFNELRHATAAELQRPIALVEQLIGERWA